MIRTVIVDDEHRARQRLARLLRAYPDIEVLGEAGDGRAAADLVARLRPDAVFLDIRMPKLSGFGMLARVDPSPYIIFTTAYDQHALRAFEENTLDYLLKPISKELLDRAIAKLRRALGGSPPAGGGGAGIGLEEILARLGQGGSVLRRFSVGAGRRVLIVHDHEVDYFHAEDKYTMLRRKGKSYIVPFTMKQLVERLDPDRFARAHRAFIVNLDQIESAERVDGGRLRLRLKCGEELPVSRRHAEVFRGKIGM